MRLPLQAKLLIIFKCFAWFATVKTGLSDVYNIGVVLPVGSQEYADWVLIKPALDVAREQAKMAPYNTDINIIYFDQLDEFKYLMCDPSVTWYSVRLAQDLLQAAKSNQAPVQMILGPACPDDFNIVVMASTGSLFTNVTLMTGQAEELIGIEGIPNFASTGYNNFIVWELLTRGMAVKFKWTTFAGIYLAGSTNPKYQMMFEGARLGITGTNAQGDAVANTSSGTFFEVPCNLPNQTDPHFIPQLTACLGAVVEKARVILLLFPASILRQAMITAYKNNMITAEYIYITVDMIHDQFLNLHPPRPVWQANDTDDAVAKEAFRDLLIIGLEPYYKNDNYRKLATAARHKAQDDGAHFKMNYFIATFYDAVMLYTARVSSGPPITRNPNNFCQFLPQDFSGASGVVNVNLNGTRIFTTYLYAMTDVEKGIYTPVANYEAISSKFKVTSTIPWLGGSPPLDVPVCGFDGQAFSCFPLAQVVGGIVTGVVVIALTVFSVRFYKQRKADKATDNEWIAPLKQLTFRRRRVTTEAGNDGSPLLDTSSRGHSEQDLGNSMGQSMRQSMGTSMGAHNMSSGMRKKLTAMGEHFGIWNKVPVVLRWIERKCVRITNVILKEVRVVRKLHHENVAAFVGGCMELNNICMLYEMCSKGPLNLMFTGDERSKLDWAIRMSWTKDIVNGMAYLHSSHVGAHTRLTSGCCFIDIRFTLKITDYGLHTIFTHTISEYWMSRRSLTDHSAKLLWTSPEVLRAKSSGVTDASLPAKEMDVYSFAIILQEIILRDKPYCQSNMSNKEIIDEVRKGSSLSGLPFRPKLKEENVHPHLTELCTKCWSEDPGERPTFEKVKITLRAIAKEMNMGDQTNIMDIFIEQMEEAGEKLQIFVDEKANKVLEQTIKSDRAFMGLFPSTVADRVMRDEPVEPELFENATIFMTDIMGFETICVQSQPSQITTLLNDLYQMLDGLISDYQCFKVVAGIFGESAKDGAREIARLALFSMVEIKKFVIPHRPEEQAKLRIGITTGPVIMTELNFAAPRLGVCGETTNVAKRILQTADQLKIHVSTSTKNFLDGYNSFRFDPSPVSPVYISDDIEMQTFWLVDEIGNSGLKQERAMLADGIDFQESLRTGLQIKNN